MKTFRTWLAILLVCLVPIRGAVAAGMLCEMELPFAATAVASSAQHHHDPAAHQAAEHHAHHDEAEAPAAGADESAAGADACSLCAGCCSAAALVGSLPVLLVAQVLNSVSFPSLAAAAPSFISGGPERPPRSI